MKRIASVVLVIAAIYFWPAFSDWGWHLHEYVMGLRPWAAKPPTTVVVQQTAPMPKAVRKPSTAKIVEHWTTIRIESVPTPEQPVTVETPEPTTTTAKPTQTGPDPYESKFKRGLKSIGRFIRKTQ
jgi:hypothetical protein